MEEQAEYGNTIPGGESNLEQEIRKVEEGLKKLHEKRAAINELRPGRIMMAGEQKPADNWKHRADNMRCRTCMWFVPKESSPPRPMHLAMGRCRRHAPTMNGWPVMYVGDWCGDHKLDENKI
jgi:hypothetical protein